MLFSNAKIFFFQLIFFNIEVDHIYQSKNKYHLITQSRNSSNDIYSDEALSQIHVQLIVYINVSASQPRDHGFESHTGHNH